MRSNTSAIAKPEHAALNPLVAGAAASVLFLSLIGAGAIVGVLPSALSERHPDLRQMRETIAEYRPIAGSCSICGTVDSIRAARVTGDQTGLGAVTGGLTGALVRNPLERGNASLVTTILGAAGGAFAGNEIDKSAKRQFAYRVTIRMDDGSFRTVSLPSAPAFTVGDKVRVVEGKLVRA
jgi:outer membrane lipoprotein SlyB